MTTIIVMVFLTLQGQFWLGTWYERNQSLGCTESLSLTPVSVHMRGWKPRDGKGPEEQRKETQTLQAGGEGVGGVAEEETMALVAR